MKPYILAVAFAAAFLAGCDQDEPTASTQAPTTASGGANSGATSTGPAGDKMSLPEPPKASASAEDKPDPGDANDHSTPQHDAKSKKNSD